MDDSLIERKVLIGEGTDVIGASVQINYDQFFLITEDAERIIEKAQRDIALAITKHLNKQNEQ